METKCDYKKITLEEIKLNIDKYKIEFSEGNKDLEKCLERLWENDIETIGCCAGNPDREVSHQYIGIKITSDTKKKILNLISNLPKNNIRTGIVYKSGKYSCGIHKADNEKADIFENILEAIDHINDDSKTDEIFAELLDAVENEFAVKENDNYYNYQIYYHEDNQNIYLNTDDLDIIKEYKDKYEYKILNEKIHLYHFKI